MSYVILCRNPSTGRVIAMVNSRHPGDDDPPIATFETEAEAETAALDIPACQAWPYSIVEAP